MEKRLQYKIDAAIDFLKRGEKLALSLNEQGYFVAFSGGKDSQVLLWLVQQAKVKYKAYYSVTTNDPLQNVQFIRKYYKEVIFLHPKDNFYTLVEKNGLPLRQMRYCCKVLKESAGAGFATLVGVRREESVRRSKYDFVDVVSRRKEHKERVGGYDLDDMIAVNHQCIKGKDKVLLRPMLDFTEKDVWTIINEFHLPKNPCYEKVGRVGCIFCPFSSRQTIERYCIEYPKVKETLLKSISIFLKNKPSIGLSKDEYFDWWLSDMSLQEYKESKKQLEMDFSNHG